MPIYTVSREEYLVRGATGSAFSSFKVEANSEEEAIQSVKDGKFIDSEFEWNDVPGTEPDDDTYQAELAGE
jgi:hypothetical protein